MIVKNLKAKKTTQMKSLNKLKKELSSKPIYLEEHETMLKILDKGFIYTEGFTYILNESERKEIKNFLNGLHGLEE